MFEQRGWSGVRGSPGSREEMLPGENIVCTGMSSKNVIVYMHKTLILFTDM